MQRSLNIALTVVAVVLLGGLVYYVLIPKNASPVPVAPNQNINTQLPPVNNNQNIPPANTPATTTINYQNTQYGFNFTLPASWKGYSIVTDKWQGYGDTENPAPIEQGPLISIRHPLWTVAVPRQDIPIMVFSLTQWDALQTGDSFHIGAAPINPSELGRNAKYVFALPARYNFAYPVGFEEVDTIIQGKPLSAY